MKKTKIICTLGPATDNDQVLADMIKAGMDVARFNFSHGDYDAQSKRLEQLMRVREAQGVPVATLLDTKGPEIRTGDFEDPNGVVIHKGDTFTLTTKKCLGDAKHCYVNYPGLVEDVEVGTSILINDGLIAMEVTELRRDEIVCRVTDGGLLTNKKGVNVPDISLNMPYLSPADMQDLEFGASHDFDFIAASFVRTAGDVIYLRNFCQALGWNDVRIIAKIENMEGVNNIDAIIEEADGIMVARGDMGVEIPFERIPAIQKMIIRKVYSAGKVVVTATQMLESMITNPRPTRAEITDVANAIYDGTSAIMLSGETAMGAHPVEAVQTATVTTAHDLGAAAIVTVTQSGTTARMISKYRPDVPIIGATTEEKVLHQLMLSWGVVPVRCVRQDNTDALFDHAVEVGRTTGLIHPDDIVVITAGIPLGASGTTNMLKVQTVR